MPDIRNIAIWLLLGFAAAGWGAGCVERQRTASVREDLATEKRSRAEENTARALVALADLQRTVVLMATHAKTQKENVDAYEARLDVLAGRGRTVAAELGRVREQYRAYAGRDREQAATDPSACIRIADRSEILADVAARGRELLERGRLLVEGRDAEIAVLIGIVENDRRLANPIKTSAIDE